MVINPNTTLLRSLVVNYVIQGGVRLEDDVAGHPDFFIM